MSNVPFDIFDAIIEPIRDADEREGRDFLYRYFRGPQSVWETTDQKIKDIPDLWSVTDCPDEYLKYLKWIVGWTSALSNITDELSDDELRRLISISGRLWKLRGPEDTIVDVMRFATGQRCRVWNWFDFRWITGETDFSEDHDGRDPWMIAAADTYESNLRIVDEGDLNRTLVVNLLKLMRASGERWEITYLSFLDQFISDGDDSQWQKSVADSPSLTVSGGTLTLTDTSQFEWTWTNSEAVTWSTYMAFFRLRGTSTTTGPTGHGFAFYRSDVNNYYTARCVPADKKIYLYRVASGTPVLIGTADLGSEPYFDDVYYGYRAVVTVEETTKLRIRIYVDGFEVLSVLDASPLAAGTVAVWHDSGETIEVSEVEVMDLPGESDYVDINS